MDDGVLVKAAENRARAAWNLMNANEQAAVRFGLIPSWIEKADFGGRLPGKALADVAGVKGFSRLMTLTLFELTKNVGGMVV